MQLHRTERESLDHGLGRDSVVVSRVSRFVRLVNESDWEVKAMKYLLLLHGDAAAEAALEPGQRRAIVDEHIAFQQRLESRGQLVRGEPLAAGDGAFAVRLQRDGTRLVTDGPFAETKEQLGSYYVIECDGRDEAEAVAREVPASPGLVVEAWPVAEI
jgi:hypothetical protein